VLNFKKKNNRYNQSNIHLNKLKMNVFSSLSLLFIGLLLMVSCSSPEPQEVWNGSYEDVKELVHQTKGVISEITVEDLHEKMQGTADLYLIDIREADEFEAGSIPGAVLIPRGLLEFRISKDEFWTDEGSMKPGKDYPIVVYCRTGGRSALGASSLMQLGYSNVFSLEGGFTKWELNYPEEVYPVREMEYEMEVEDESEDLYEELEKEVIEVEPAESSAEGGC
jgi:rhodanese-related sulfurtransferase